MARQSSKKPKTEVAKAAEPIAASNKTNTTTPAAKSPEKASQKKAKSSGAPKKSSGTATAKAQKGGKGGSKPAAKKANGNKTAPKKTDGNKTAPKKASNAKESAKKPTSQPAKATAKATPDSIDTASAAVAASADKEHSASEKTPARSTAKPAAEATAAKGNTSKKGKPTAKTAHSKTKKADRSADSLEPAAAPTAAAAKRVEESNAPADSSLKPEQKAAAFTVAPVTLNSGETATEAPAAVSTTNIATPASVAPTPIANSATPSNLGTMPAIAYGQVNSLQKKRSRKGAIAAIAVIAAVVIAAVVIAPKVIDSMRPERMLPSTAGPVTVLTTTRVTDDLENADIPLPDLATYSYILTDDLIGPRFSTPDIEDMVQTVSGADPVYSQKITTKATYNNKGIRIVVPISMVYTYNEDGQTWVRDEPVLGTPETTPLSAASYEAVLEDIDLIIRNYDDTEYKTLFKAAEVTSQSSNLTKDGGTIAVGLYTQTDTYTASSTATVELAWDNGKGWVATITEATTPERVERNLEEELLAKQQEEEEEKEEEEYANEERPQYYIECSSSDVVEFNGKMSKAGNGYLLTLNDPLRLTLDGKLCYVYTVQLNFGEYEAYSVYKPEDIDPAALVGSNQGFAGTLSLTSAGSQAVKDAAAKDRDHASEKGAPLVAMQVIEV